MKNRPPVFLNWVFSRDGQSFQNPNPRDTWCGVLCAGCCFLVGGTQYHQQSFNQGINKVASCLSLLAVPCPPGFPSAFKLSSGLQADHHSHAIRLLVLVLVLLLAACCSMSTAVGAVWACALSLCAWPCALCLATSHSSLRWCSAGEGLHLEGNR